MSFVVIALTLTACGEVAQLPLSAGVGSHPQLPPPNPTLIPTVNIAEAVGWPVNGKPIAASGMTVNAFASGLDHPRWLYVLPNGDVLVAETNAPQRPEDRKGVKGWIMQQVMNKAGAGAPSANRITLLRDADGDGVAETRTVFIDGLNSPFGMALVGNNFYVADTDALLKFPYSEGETRIAQTGAKVLELPAGSINHHWTKNLLSSRDGSKLYVTVGSNSNVAENGIDQELGRAAIWEVDLQRGSHRIFASGLRNPNGLAWEPDSGALWTVVNERDEIGSDLVPDYLTSVADGSFFGWPYSYFGGHLDERAQPQRPDLVAKASVPDYALGAHTASLGLAFSKNTVWPAPFDNGFFIGQHGSWNRKPRSGYKVIFVPFKDGKPFGEPLDVLKGFVNEAGEAFGRPVGVVLDKQAALLVADDVGNIVWRVTASTTTNKLTQTTMGTQS
ncbi:MAG: PQQ-dependent sugar dehydrogenase [Methylococcaceae bacterium]